MGRIVAASQLAVKGAKVLVLEQYVIPVGSSGFYERDGLKFDVGSSVMFGFGGKVLCDRYFEVINYPVGGVGVTAKALAKGLVNQGSEILYKINAMNIILENGKAVSLSATGVSSAVFSMIFFQMDSLLSFLELEKKLFPGLKSSIVFKEVGTPKTNRRYLACDSGTYGPIPRRVPKGLMGLLFNTTAINGVYCVGHSCFPGQGVIAVAFSGVMCARRVAADLEHD
ncbi:carotenoid isomerase [Olea europaea subsp. europaea]|uniref:Carotenoid isomerase n=1 Tax=Olea europaea subsp. europaea TaxID=158383 RepID=A0A8S0URZ0_OLEEU|nr:carotenoid isomerase [Olea europaea subsp. europaea]